MLTSLALLLLSGMLLAALCEKIKLPRMLGMLAAGILLGSSALNVLDTSLLNISAQLRQMALVLILLRAGLSLRPDDLRKVGRPAVLMAFVPATCELIGYVLLAPMLLGISRVEAAVMGAVMAAVSPAVVVPRMVALMEEKRGTKQGIPQMIMAGASCDDVFVIVLFSTFSSMAQGGSVRAADFVGIPVSIVLGILVGLAVGFALQWLMAHTGMQRLPGIQRAVVLTCAAFLLLALETCLKGIVPLSGLLAAMSMAFAVNLRGRPEDTRAISGALGKAWSIAEILLFSLVGAAVDVRYTLQAGWMVLILLLLALVFRAAGVLLCMAKTGLTARERLYCVLAYLPKATVQAAIGATPLAMGLPCGELVLSVAVVGILVTAPMGAIGMDWGKNKLLTLEK